MMCGFEALVDRISIRNYLLPRNPHAAKRVFLRLKEATKDLAMFPYMGRDGDDGTCEWVIVHPYVPLYEVDEPAQIVRVPSVWLMSQDRP
ncbi:type II toxin-antitoxin system RelE/ParE family toxin [Gluconobacter wancherniae]|nr:type II toxin-antitoxin system RelE/ParE family toxin [Gluconobacter wancherniae]